MYRNGKHMYCLTWIVDEKNQDMLENELSDDKLYLCIDDGETQTGKQWKEQVKAYPVRGDYFKLVEVSHPYDFRSCEPNQELVEACETVLAGDYEGDDIRYDDKIIHCEFNVTYGRGYHARTVWYELEVDIEIDGYEKVENPKTGEIEDLPTDFHIKEGASVYIRRIR